MFQAFLIIHLVSPPENFASVSLGTTVITKEELKTTVMQSYGGQPRYLTGNAQVAIDEIWMLLNELFNLWRLILTTVKPVLRTQWRKLWDTVVCVWLTWQYLKKVLSTCPEQVHLLVWQVILLANLPRQGSRQTNANKWPWASNIFLLFVKRTSWNSIFFLSLHRLPIFLYGVARNSCRSLFLQFGNF